MEPALNGREGPAEQRCADALGSNVIVACCLGLERDQPLLSSRGGLVKISHCILSPGYLFIVLMIWSQVPFLET